MKLFSPTQVREVKTYQDQEKIHWLKKLEAEIAKRTNQLDSLNFDEEKARLQKEFEAFIKDQQARRLKLLSEIEILQTKRNTLSIPLAGWERELADREAKLRLEKLALESNKADSESIKTKLLAADSAFSHLKDNLAKREQEIFSKEQQLRQNEDNLATSTAELDSKWKEFQATSTTFKTGIQTRLSELEEKEHTVEQLRLTLEKELAETESRRTEKLRQVDEQLADAVKLAKSTEIRKEVLQGKENQIQTLQKDVSELQKSIKERTKTLDKQEHDLEKRGQLLNQEFEKLGSSKALLVEATQTHKAERDTLRNEVLILEGRKKEALKPIEQVIKEVEAKSKALDKAQIQFTNSQEIFAQDTETLRLERQKLKELKSSLNIKSAELKTQSETLLQLDAQLEKRQQEFSEYETRIKNEHQLKAQELRAKEFDLDSQIQAYRTLKDELDTQFNLLEQAKAKLKDERVTLDSAWQELKHG